MKLEKLEGRFRRLQDHYNAALNHAVCVARAHGFSEEESCVYRTIPMARENRSGRQMVVASRKIRDSRPPDVRASWAKANELSELFENVKRDLVRALLKQGQTPKQVAERLGIPVEQVQSISKR